jgi:hypothetical protein
LKDLGTITDTVWERHKLEGQVHNARFGYGLTMSLKGSCPGSLVSSVAVFRGGKTVKMQSLGQDN